MTITIILYTKNLKDIWWIKMNVARFSHNTSRLDAGQKNNMLFFLKVDIILS
jgi:hypothetical protein